MRITKLKIPHFKVLENIDIDFGSQDEGSVHPIISVNGGGKSTLLQFLFTLLHFGFKRDEEGFVDYHLDNLLESTFFPENTSTKETLAEISVQFLSSKADLIFSLCKSNHNGLDLDLLHEYLSLSNSANKFKDYNIFIETLSDFFNSISTYSKNNTLIEIKRSINVLKSLLENFRQESVFFANSMELSFIYDYDSLSKFSDVFKEEYADSMEIIKRKHKELYSLNEKRNKIKNNLLNLRKWETENYYAGKLEKSKGHVVISILSTAKKLVDLQFYEKVKLIAPITQIFHFLNSSEKKELFKENSEYLDRVRDEKWNLNNFSTYDSFPISLVNDAYRKARNNDFKSALSSDGKYGNELQTLIEQFDSFLSGKRIVVEDIDTEDDEFLGVHFVSKKGEKLPPESLSHGELKKLNIFLWLRQMKDKEGVFLMDEVDLGLHPSWQMEIVEDLKKWAPKAQFLLATHSPQIISSVPYENIVVLNKNEMTGKSESLSIESPPVGADVNSIIRNIMGADYLPKRLQELYGKYEQIIKKQKEDSTEGKNTKEQIMQIESESSKFLQRMDFISKLNKKKVKTS
jgi:ABC-type multidrug transport system ATPase subunit